jgi:hypothetical protein
MDARPHPGKFNEQFTSEDMARLHGEHFNAFQEQRAQYDPERKFENEFTRRLFG